MKVVGWIVGIAALLAAGYALATWWVMVLLGAVHHDVSSTVPALGFWQTLLVVLLIGAVGGVFNSARYSKKD